MNSAWKKQIALASLLTVAACRAMAAEPGGWQVEVVDTSGYSKFSSMKIDRDGNVHVAYMVTSSGFLLKYAFWDHRIKKWFTMNVDGNVGMCALELDSKQRPHISYTDYGTGYGSKLRHAYWDGSTWQKEAIRLDSEIIGYYNSIAFDLQDNPSLTFYEYRGSKDTEHAIRLRNVMRKEGIWEVRTVDPVGGSGKFNAMVADTQGHLHLAYANVTTGDMRYAYWDGKAWAREMVEVQKDAGGYVGQAAAIAVDSARTPHVAYADVSNRLIKYAVRKPGGWQVQAVDRVGGVAYPDRYSIVLDEDGRPYITYYDGVRSSLKLAFREGTRWIAGTVDANHAGFTSSVQISQGVLWISYADEANAGLKVARIDLQSLRASFTGAGPGEPQTNSPTQARK